jgi:hypothetical protein
MRSRASLVATLAWIVLVSNVMCAMWPLRKLFADERKRGRETTNRHDSGIGLAEVDWWRAELGSNEKEESTGCAGPM